MTTEPSPDPRDVIARDIIVAVIHRGFASWKPGEENVWECAADIILAAIDTDPAVADALITGHTDAILAALTRAGVLGKERNAVSLPCGCLTHVTYACQSGCAFTGPRTRLVTPWREAT